MSPQPILDLTRISSGSAATPDPIFKFPVVTLCPGVPEDIMVPSNTWSDKAAYTQAANKLAKLFNDNFVQYADGVSEAVRNAGPAPT